MWLTEQKSSHSNHSHLLNSAKFCAMSKKQQFAFSRINFYLLAAAIVIILVGFVLMSGKGSTDTHFDPSIFDQRRTVIAPMVCFVGYLFMIVAILYRSKDKSDATSVAKMDNATTAAHTAPQATTTAQVNPTATTTPSPEA